MCRIQNITRKDGTYHFRRLMRSSPDKPFRLRFPLKTTSRKRAALKGAYGEICRSILKHAPRPVLEVQVGPACFPGQPIDRPAGFAHAVAPPAVPGCHRAE